MLKKVALGIATSAALALAGGSVAFADTIPGGTPGQPGQSCQSQPASPGNAANTSAAAFNPLGTAATHYAGTQPQNSTNPKSVSQYDVACFQVSQH
jgi:hypothetical protein